MIGAIVALDFIENEELGLPVSSDQYISTGRDRLDQIGHNSFVFTKGGAQSVSY